MDLEGTNPSRQQAGGGPLDFGAVNASLFSTTISKRNMMLRGPSSHSSSKPVSGIAAKSSKLCVCHSYILAGCGINCGSLSKVHSFPIVGSLVLHVFYMKI